MAFKATHYAWRGRNRGEGHSTFWAQFAAKSLTFCRRGNASAIRKLSRSNLRHGSSIQRSYLHDTATPPDHDLKTYGTRGEKALMQLETAMDGVNWRPSGWPLYPPSFEDGSIQAMVKYTTAGSALFMRSQICRSSCNVNSAGAGVDSTGFAREHFPVLNVPHSSVFPSLLPACTEMRRLKHFTVSEAFHCSLGLLAVFFF